MTPRSRRLPMLVLLAAVAAVALPRPAAALVSADPDATWQTNGRVNAVAYLGNTVYLGGSFTAVRDPSNGNATTRNRLAAFDATTGALLAWNPNANNTVRALVVSPAGTRVYAGGAFTAVGGATRYRVAALHPSSGAAFGWAPYVNDDVKAVTTSNSGAHVYLGGDFTSVEGAGRRHLADVGASSGALSTAFKPNVAGASFPTVLALDVSADGDTLYVGGFFSSIKGVARRNTGAVSTVVATLRSWRPTGTTSTVSSLTVSRSGRTVFVGGRGAGGFVHAYGPTAGGAPVWTAAANGDVEALVVSSATLYVGGHFTSIGGAGRGHMAAMRAAGGGLEAWNPGADGALGVYGAAIASGHVAMGGEFTQVAGEAHQGFAQFSGTP
jgi:hypothetical protein